MGMPKIKGRCMACGRDDTLFLASGGYITCSRDKCPDPGAVADWLDRPSYHTLRLGADGFSLQHPVTCFPDLTACDIHGHVSDRFPTAPPSSWFGLYRVAVDVDPAYFTLDPIDERSAS